jgi:hypothetical protein
MYHNRSQDATLRTCQTVRNRVGRAIVNLLATTNKESVGIVVLNRFFSA